MKQIDVILLWAAGAMLIALFALARTSPGQEEKQPDKSTATSQDATIYPVPNYGGDLWSRSYLTGDWGGLRSKLADRGVQFDSNVTQIYQGVASGGTNRTGRYSGSTRHGAEAGLSEIGTLAGGISNC